MIQFYSPDILESQWLDKEESGHCIRVLRKKPGDKIFVTDGKGTRYECEIVSTEGKIVKYEIVGKVEIPKNWDFDITLVVAPTKATDRMEWLVEKATEIGVDRICFALTRHAERKHLNVDRMRRIALSAMNQSLKVRMPEITELTALDKLLDTDGEKFFGYCDDSFPRLSFAQEFKPGSDITVVIGPEGDFSPEEVKTMSEKGYKAVTFGNERLRTETAALYAVTAIHVLTSANTV